MNGDEIIDLVTDPATKQSLSGSMLPNIKTCNNRWSNLSENLRIVALKFLKLTTNLQLSTLILNMLVVRCDVDIFKLTASAQSINREVYACK